VKDRPAVSVVGDSEFDPAVVELNWHVDGVGVGLDGVGNQFADH
jgi:hypothetical protein